MSELFKLFFCFFKIGLFTFGGGYAMLPALQREVVDKHHWCTEKELHDYYSIGQCTPGIIAVNTATFIGYKHQQVLGSIFATLGLILPSILIIIIISSFIQQFTEIIWIQHAFSGIRIAVCALILSSLLRIKKNSLIDTVTWAMFLGILALLLIFPNLSPAILVVASGVMGICFYIWKEKRKS